MSMIQVGPYVFTQQDARKTLVSAPVILETMRGNRDPNPIAHLAREVDALLNGIDPMTTHVALLPDLLKRVWTALEKAPSTLRSGGHVPVSRSGAIVQVNTSKGGVPKSPVTEAYVGWRGIEGDVQKAREHHGRPFQALCMWSAEVIDRLRADGHPIDYGSAGENITIRGLDWNDVRPGVRLRIGEAMCEVWAYAVPCKKNAPWMKDGDFGRLHHDRESEFGGAISRVYATVTARGMVHPGDTVTLEP
ncbi:MAG: MOSC domain-containing protein [Actinobacteria bacterium]|nr:MOSC domain-containing protein [Actinomycetota bacterium]